MKKVIICMVACMYAFAVMKPALSLVQDLVAHTFYKASHLATVHYENGVMHLHAELAQAATDKETQSSPPNPFSLKSSDPLPDHLTGEFRIAFTIQSGAYLHSPVTIKAPVSRFQQIVSPPPEA